MRVVLLGPPGSGKGTQARLLSQRLQVPVISTGEILRAAVREGTSVGIAAKAVMESGELVSDDLMVGLIRERIAAADAQGGFVLDGFPRTVEQARALEKLLEGDGKPPLVVVNLSVPETVVEDRLHGRSAEQHRSDDRPETILERLRVYHRKTEPLIGFYRERRLLTDVDGMGDVEEIAHRIDGALARAGRERGVA